MEAALRAIVEPRRRRILRLIRRRELSAGQIASHFDVTRPAVSQHISILKHARLVTERRAGTRRLYRARPQGLAELRAFLEEFWDSRLALLKHAAEAEERKGLRQSATRGRIRGRLRRPSSVRFSPCS